MTTKTNTATIVGYTTGASNLTFVNTGSVTPNGVALTGASDTAVNAGLISGKNGVQLNGGGVTNQSVGIISGTVDAVVIYQAAGTIVNAGRISGQTGVWLSKGGAVTNQATGSISGTSVGVYAPGYAVTVINVGAISGGTYSVKLASGVTNKVVVNPGASFTGKVSGGNGVDRTVVSTLELAAGSQTGTLNGFGSHYVGFNEFTVDSGASWKLTGGSLGLGVTVGGGGTLTNAQGNTIANPSSARLPAGAGVYLDASATLINAGSISGQYGVGGASGSVTNQSTGTVTAVWDAVKFVGGPGTVINDGLLAAGSASVGVYLEVGGSIVNTGSISGKYGVRLSTGGSVTNQSTGSIGGTSGVISGGAAATVVNAGAISGGTYAIRLGKGFANKVVINPGASFTGKVFGGNTIGATAVSTLELAGSQTGTLTGFGSQYVGFNQLIVDSGASWKLTGQSLGLGVTVIGGGTLTNAQGDTIANPSSSRLPAGAGVYLGTSATLVNAGSVSGQYGVGGASGSVTNQSIGTVTAVWDAVKFVSGVGTVVNAGRLVGGSASVGVYLKAGGTVVNAGAISGGSYAVRLDPGFTNKVVINPGASFNGKVSGGNTVGATAVSTLELAAGTQASKLSGFGSQYVGFNQINVDAGASWTLAGGSLGLGVTVGDGGTLTNDPGDTIANPSSARLPAGAGVYLIGSAILVNAGSISGQYGVGGASGSATNQSNGTVTAVWDAVKFANGAGTVVNAGRLAGGSGSVGVYLKAGGSIVNTGSISGGYGVRLNAGGTVTNQRFGAISGGSDGVKAAGAATTVVNAGLIAGGSYAVSLAAGFANRVVIDARGTFTGKVSGGNTVGSTAVSTLELGIVGQTGTLAGFGSQYVGFNQVTVDANASWKLTGGSLGLGVTVGGLGTLTNAQGNTIAGPLSARLPGGAGVYLGASATLVNAGSISGQYGVGGASGSATNQSTGTVTAFWDAVKFVSGTGTVVNAGRLVGGSASVGAYLKAGGSVVNTGVISGGYGIRLNAGGTVTNQTGGTIAGGNFGVRAAGAAGTVTNAGTISGGTDAVALATGFANRVVIDPGASFVGTVSGGNTVGATAVSALELAGTQAGTLAGFGSHYIGFNQVTVDQGAIWTLTGGILGQEVTVGAGGTLTNAQGNTIANSSSAALARGSGVYLASGGTLINAGSISGQYGVGAGYGSVTNQSAGTVTAVWDAVKFVSGAGTVVNAGRLAGGSGSVGAYLKAGGTVVNTGSISGRYGVRLTAGGSVINQRTGNISGLRVGIDAYAGKATVDNAGTIAGLNLRGGGSVTNESTGIIAGAYIGINVTGVAGTVVNAGTVSGSQGAALKAGGIVTNQINGTIAGTAIGIYMSAATAVNAGTVTGRNGVSLHQGSSLINQSTGGIFGTMSGVYAFQAATVVNAGAISGGSYAVKLAAGFADRLVIDPGASFSGKVSGGNTAGATAASTLELATGTAAGTLTGLGSQFVDFTGITIDTGAAWTLTGANTLAAGYMLTNSGRLTIRNGSLTGAGTLANNGTALIAPGSVTLGALTGTGAVTIAANSTLEVTGALAAGETIVLAGAGARVQLDTPSAALGTVVANAGVFLLFGGSFTNQSAGRIGGGQGYGIFAEDAPATIVNAGTVTGKSGVYLASGGSVINQGAGYIHGAYSGIDAKNGAASVVNAGRIAGYYGVFLESGGSVTNQGTGTIAGTLIGVAAATAGITVVNAGTVSGKFGVNLLSGGSVINLSTGTIAGAKVGVAAVNAGITVVNAGAISGGTYAVYLAGGPANRLVIDPGASFSGKVSGGPVGSRYASTLELAAGTSASTLTGFGSQYVGFDQLTVDAGASWTLAGGTVAEEVALGAGATLTNAQGNTIANPFPGTLGLGSGAYLAAAATLVNAGSISGRYVNAKLECPLFAHN